MSQDLPIAEILTIEYPILYAEVLESNVVPNIFQIVRIESFSDDNNGQILAIVKSVKSGPRFAQGKQAFGLSPSELNSSYPELAWIERTELELLCFSNFKKQNSLYLSPLKIPALHSRVFSCDKIFLSEMGVSSSGRLMLSKLVATFGSEPSLVLSLVNQVFDWPNNKKDTAEPLMDFLKLIFDQTGRDLEAIAQICKQL